MIDDSGINGFGRVSGGTYKNFKIAGSAIVTEECKAIKIKIAGNADFKKSVTAKTFKVAGRCSVGGNIKVENISIAGSFTTNGNIDAENANFAGTVYVDGDINCEEFEANVTGSSFKNIYGESISFHKGNSISSRSTIEEIAATKINIENVKVNKVSGEFVIIGDDCIVDVVEYNNTLSLSKKAQISRIVKI